MEIQDQTGIINPNPPSVPGNQMQVDVRTSSANGGDKHNILKVRKPYTITKHRERWAEEEHKKFLEALQLYGRVWRRIEEHIGPKTAVQIRSRAQKFFSKVVRKSDADSTGNVKPIETPPPRSKRKPAHPYPRKSGNTCSSVGLSISKLERSFSPVKSAFEGENGSPTSVLFGFGSDTLGSLLSNVQNSCTSPVTSAAGSNEQETSVEEENNLPLSRHDQSVMELDTSSKGSVPPKEASLLEEEQVPCLKLFGKTVMMTDKPKPSSPGAGDTTQDPNSLPTLSIGIQGRSAPSQNFAQGSVPGDFPPWSGIVLPMLYPLSWWGMCENSPQFPFIHHQEEISRRVTRRPSAEVPADKEGQRECCSWTGSNTTSASDGQSAAKDDSTAMQSTRAGSDASARGFASYKRCVAETEVQQDSRRCWKSESPIPRSNTTCWASKFTKSRLDFNRRMANDGEGQSVSVGLCL